MVRAGSGAVGSGRVFSTLQVGQKVVEHEWGVLGKAL